MKGSIKFVLAVTFLLISFNVALAENTNTANNMNMPMNKTANVSTNNTTNMTMNMHMEMSCMAMPMNMNKPMKMPMNMSMPMNSGDSSTKIILLQNVTLNVFNVQNMTEITVVALPSVSNNTKSASSDANPNKSLR